MCEWIKQLKFLDGYSSNLSRCINLDEGKIYGMKSHDCHVFMQRLIPLTFRDMLPRPIWKVLTKLSLFFKEICAHQCRKGFLPRLFSTFCLGSGTETYWGEAKRYIFWPRLLPEAIDPVFCPGLGKNRGIFLYSSVPQAGPLQGHVR